MNPFQNIKRMKYCSTNKYNKANDQYRSSNYIVYKSTITSYLSWQRNRCPLKHLHPVVNKYSEMYIYFVMEQNEQLYTCNYTSSKYIKNMLNAFSYRKSLQTIFFMKAYFLFVVRYCVQE